MLGVRTYTTEYIEACRERMDAAVEAFDELAGAARNQPSAARALVAFETTYFNNLVIVLDHLFVHRLRTVEGKDGNPLNEVRLLCDSLIENQGRLRANTTIKYVADKSVLNIQVGDDIRLSQADFVRLCAAFFAELERKFSEEAVSQTA